MRIWTLHPRYLDRQALVAVWREGLLAQAVLLGRTRGYRHHPQLVRFQQLRSPVAGVATYLTHIHEEATRRGYVFDQGKIGPNRMRKQIDATRGQLLYEWQHLVAKLEARSPEWLKTVAYLREPIAHPLFRIVPGPVASWERILSYTNQPEWQRTGDSVRA